MIPSLKGDMRYNSVLQYNYGAATLALQTLIIVHNRRLWFGCVTQHTPCLLTTTEIGMLADSSRKKGTCWYQQEQVGKSKPTWALREASTSCVRVRRLSAAATLCSVVTTAAAASEASVVSTAWWRRQLSHMLLHGAGASAKCLQHTCQQL